MQEHLLAALVAVLLVWVLWAHFAFPFPVFPLAIFPLTSRIVQLAVGVIQPFSHDADLLYHAHLETHSVPVVLVWERRKPVVVWVLFSVVLDWL
jgi:hypothetical protein